jgi:hypothetical protein
LLNQHKADTAQVPVFFALKKGVKPAVRAFPLTDTLFAIHGRSLIASLPLEGRLGETPLTAGSAPYRAALALQGVFEVSFVSNQQYAAPTAQHDINLPATTAQH